MTASQGNTHSPNWINVNKFEMNVAELLSSWFWQTLKSFLVKALKRCIYKLNAKKGNSAPVGACINCAVTMAMVPHQCASPVKYLALKERKLQNRAINDRLIDQKGREKRRGGKRGEGKGDNNNSSRSSKHFGDTSLVDRRAWQSALWVNECKKATLIDIWYWGQKSSKR